MGKIELGKYNNLCVVKEVDFGLYLDGDEAGEILLPSRYVPEGTQVGDELRVFLYLDNEERLIATTLEPLVQVGQFAWLEVAWVNQFGAFLNWGLMKDLFVPFREQKMHMMQGKSYLIYCHLDEESYRIVGTAKIEKYLSEEYPPYHERDEVEIIIWQKTDLGFKAIVDNKYSGLIYDNEVFTPLRSGMTLKAYIKLVRPDGKIDLILQQKAFAAVGDFAEVLLQHLRDKGGFTRFNDKSNAEDIYNTFGVSKKIFKKAVGDLYRRGLISLFERGIQLNLPNKKDQD
ncbi:MAG: GntR family transcriptional regulator [Bacteroidaceae bacterium]|nr:GntR family transcriptional regulator [Bacteroidaceae bacterium]MBP9636829.1 GntR family transcriptional regulator [Bacteroidaceae bacterium]